jgi:hypothetical protein
MKMIRHEDLGVNLPSLAMVPMTPMLGVHEKTATTAARISTIAA